ncbi:MAG: DHH family phosphoesterase [Armatimonadota bacterium]
MTQARRDRVAETAETIRKASSLALACHIRPDADALGSLLGLALGLEQLGKRVLAVSPDGVPELYRFLPSWERVVTTVEGEWEVGIGLDADGSDRLGSAEAAILALPTVIDIDHHTGPDPFGSVRLVDPTAAATGELVFHVLKALGVTLTPEIACCLMAAILTDTGCFRFGNVTAETFRISAELVEAGAHPSPIYEWVYGTRPFGASRLLGQLLHTLEHAENGQIVWASLSQEDFRKIGVDTDATEGFVDQIRMVEGSEIALFFREEHNGEVRVSLRSRGHANVAKIAEEFDGGGHVPAAGCTLPGPLPQAVARVVDAARRHLRQS